MSQTDVERLRQILQEGIPVGYGETVEWWNGLSSQDQAWEIANHGIGSDLGHVRAARDPNNSLREHDAETLRLMAESRGFAVDDYIAALVGLRDQLRGELEPEVWNIFFGPTLDIT